MRVTEKKLVWWRDVPIDVESGLLEYIARHWENEVFVISANKFETERRQCNWRIDSLQKVTFVTGVDELRRHEDLIKRLIKEDAIHIFSGIRGDHHAFLNQIKRESYSKRSCILIMESPSLYGNKVKKAIKGFLYPFLYGYYNLKYGKMFQAVFTMGCEAQKKYVSYGWNKSKVFPFMYLPLNECAAAQIKECDTENVRILYLGRFEYATKGVKVLMDAVEKISTPIKWTIDFIGGYGAQAKEIIEWCQKTEHANYGGTWPADKVIEKMNQYDFCVAPSLYDGWNMTPYQAIKAGIGCIVSDQAGSQELIEQSRAGAVVQAGNVDHLYQILLEAINENVIRESWKKAARAFQSKVSQETVGKYFVDVLEATVGSAVSNKKIKCPWLEESR